MKYIAVHIILLEKEVEEEEGHLMKNTLMEAISIQTLPGIDDSTLIPVLISTRVHTHTQRLWKTGHRSYFTSTPSLTKT